MTIYNATSVTSATSQCTLGGIFYTGGTSIGTTTVTGTSHGGVVTTWTDPNVGDVFMGVWESGGNLYAAVWSSGTSSVVLWQLTPGSPITGAIVSSQAYSVLGGTPAYANGQPSGSTWAFVDTIGNVWLGALGVIPQVITAPTPYGSTFLNLGSGGSVAVGNDGSLWVFAENTSTSFTLWRFASGSYGAYADLYLLGGIAALPNPGAGLEPGLVSNTAYVGFVSTNEFYTATAGAGLTLNSVLPSGVVPSAVFGDFSTGDLYMTGTYRLGNQGPLWSLNTANMATPSPFLWSVGHIR